MKLTKALTATFDDGTVIQLSDDVLLAVRFMLQDQNGRGPALITAIKFVRLSCGVSLKDAKDVVDGLRNNPELMPCCWLCGSCCKTKTAVVRPQSSLP